MERHYRVENARILTRSLEAHIVDHCNLTCAECCSLSPLLPAWFAHPESIAADLKIAAQVLKPRMFKLVGGEPLLHPELERIMAYAKESGIAPTISVTTNGLKLGDMAESFWQAVDALTISLYPKPGLPAKLIAHIEKQAARFNVRLNWKKQDNFTVMNRTQPNSNATEVQGIYHDCWIRERCHMIRDSMFYTCTRPAHFHTLHKGTIDFKADGLPLHEGPKMLDALLAYLQREKPLEACRHCLGGSAPVSPHRILKRTEVEALKKLYP